MSVKRMNIHKIAVIAGDGIGPEVIAEGIKVLNAAAEKDGSFRFEFTHFPWGCDYYKQTGRMMPEDGIEILSKFDAIFLGAVGAPGVPDHISLWDLLLIIRKKFDQYINLRPVKLLKGAPCPLKDAKPEDLAAIAKVRVKHGEITEYEVLLSDKNRSLEMLGKHLGMFAAADRGQEDALGKLDDILKEFKNATKPEAT